jgi:hypothetical protein
VRVKGLGCDVGVGAQLAEVRGVAQWLEDAAVVDQVGEVDHGARAVLEADVDVVAV